MTLPRLPEVEQVADEWAEAIRGQLVEAPVYQALGPPTAGKSALLTALRARLHEAGIKVVRVAPAAHELDAGPLALLQIAAGLQQAGAIDGDVESLIEPARPWRDKVSLVSGWFKRLDERVVLLCDEPLQWGEHRLVDRFAAHARDVSDLLFDLNAVRVVAGDVPGHVVVRDRRRLSPTSDPVTWLKDYETWDVLAESAAQLAESEVDLARYSPLELRLLVAHVTISSMDRVLRLVTGTVSRRQLSRRLLECLEGESRYQPLMKVWAQVALVRRPFDERLLDLCGENALDPLCRALLRHCLLYRSEEGFVMHEVLREDTRGRIDTEEARAAHHTLVDYYRQMFTNEASDNGNRLIAELETFHHATATGDTALTSDLRIFFVDQLDALGRWLSREEHRYADAAQVFRRALAWDDEDDYAHHYLAFNLDIQGRSPTEVERHYSKAIELYNQHTWWWGRFVNFLITRGRTADAQKAWDDALDALLPVMDGHEGSIYRELHLNVLITLLYRGQLEFAHSVVKSIPHRVREQEPEIDAEVRRLRALREAQRHGAVVSLDRLGREWWREPPALLPEAIASGRLLQRWLAARVAKVDDGQVELYAAEITEGLDTAPRVARAELPFERFDEMQPNVPAASLLPGMFVELGIYSKRGILGKRPEMLARVHGISRGEHLRRPFPALSRYRSIDAKTA